MSKLGSLFPEDLKPAGKPGGKNARDGIPRTFIQDLEPGQEVDQVFLVQDASMRAAKNGSKYIQAAFADRTGQIPVRHWDATDKDFAQYAIGGFVRARGRVETYQNRAQLIAFGVKAADEGEIASGDFLPVSQRDAAEMEKELDALLDSFTDPDYSRLLKALFGDAELRARFVRSPAAMNVHHAWIGGLMEHVLSASRLAQELAAQRPALNRDLLLAGVILHDIGKIEELDPGPGFNYTDTGKLCGHIALGVLIVERFILKLPGFPRTKRDLLVHLILSHHGEREHGSPVTPCIAEAVALHHIECVDAKLQGIQSILEKELQTGATSAWTDFARVVDGRIFKGAAGGRSE